jgi:hypothetical protein
MSVLARIMDADNYQASHLADLALQCVAYLEEGHVVPIVTIRLLRYLLNPNDMSIALNVRKSCVLAMTMVSNPLYNLCVYTATNEVECQEVLYKVEAFSQSFVHNKTIAGIPTGTTTLNPVLHRMKQDTKHQGCICIEQCGIFNSTAFVQCCTGIPQQRKCTRPMRV